MTDQQRIKELQKEHARLSHAMQTGVAYHLEIDSSGGTPKHLRVGVNVALRNHASLVKLLMQKGIITELEYYESIVAGMREEVEWYQETLEAIHGAKSIKLL